MWRCIGEDRVFFEAAILDPACPYVVSGVPRVGKAADSNDVTGVRRMDELAGADVDAHVIQLVEEDQVARLE